MTDFKRAVIIGGGFSGLVTAKALSAFYEEVLVIEKDDKHGSREPRFGVPQGAHLHVLLQRGQEILKALFPGIERIFIENNCPIIDWAADTRWETRSGAFPNHPSGIKTYSFSRPFIEGVVHDLLLSRCPNVSILRTQATRFRFNGQDIAGLELNKGDFDGSANLFVVAGGQSFPLERFLSDLKIQVPMEEYPTSVTYYSTLLGSGSVDLGDVRQYYYQANPLFETTGSVICPIEGNRSIATLIEYGSKPRGPLAMAELIRKAEAIPGQKLAGILKFQRSPSVVSCFHKEMMYRRRMDHVRQGPRNLIIVGDALCSMNPVFGQGMTSALIQVEELTKLLSKRPLSRFSPRTFHRNSIRKLSTPFLMSKIGSSTKESLSLRYLQNFLAKSHDSVPHHQRFLDALHLNRSLFSLIDPIVALSTLRSRSQVSVYD